MYSSSPASILSFPTGIIISVSPHACFFLLCTLCTPSTTTVVFKKGPFIHVCGCTWWCPLVTLSSKQTKAGRFLDQASYRDSVSEKQPNNKPNKETNNRVFGWTWHSWLVSPLVCSRNAWLGILKPRVADMNYLTAFMNVLGNLNSAHKQFSRHPVLFFESGLH